MKAHTHRDNPRSWTFRAVIAHLIHDHNIDPRPLPGRPVLDQRHDEDHALARRRAE